MADAAALESARRHRPSVEDYVSEGVIDHMPEVDANGQIDCKIEGHENVVRALQMNEEYRRYESNHMDSRAESPRLRQKREERAEAQARKRWRPGRKTIVYMGGR